MNLDERNKSNKDFFDMVVDIDYDSRHMQMMAGKEMIGNLLDKDIKKILDLGAGTGLELLSIFEKYPNLEVTIIDISMKMLEELKKRFPNKNLNIICGDFFEVEFDNNYDAVISSQALHHFIEDDKLYLFKKIYDSLKSNGQFINNDYFVSTQQEQDKLLEEYLSNPNLRPHMDTPLTIENEIKLLKKVGFDNVDISISEEDDYQVIYTRK